MGWCPSCSVTKQCVSLISCSTVSAWPRVTASQSQRLQMSLSDSWRHSVGIPTRLSGTFCQEPHWCCTHWSRPGFMCHAVLPAVCGRVALLLRPPTPPWTGQSVAASLSQSVSGSFVRFDAAVYCSSYLPDMLLWDDLGTETSWTSCCLLPPLVCKNMWRNAERMYVWNVGEWCLLRRRHQIYRRKKRKKKIL